MTESLKTEYKRRFGKEAIISLVAFANTDGGAVIIGMEDDGHVCGVDIGPETVQRYVNEIKIATYPQLIPKVLVEDRQGKPVLVFEVGEYPVKPVSYKNRYYRRVHNSNHVMALEEMGEFFRVELRQAAEQVTEQVTEQVIRLLNVLDRPRTRRELQDILHLQHREHFRSEYLRPALEAGLVAMTNPEKPRAADQKYILTAKGRVFIGSRE